MNSQVDQSNRRGSTLIEVVIAAALLGILGGVIASALSQFQAQKSLISTMGSRDIQIAGLVETIRSNLRYFQASHTRYDRNASPSVADRLMPNKANLPLAWSSNGAIASPENCKSCDGRMGLVIQPLDQKLALYLITIRVYHPRMNNGRLEDYQFIAAFKD